MDRAVIECSVNGTSFYIELQSTREAISCCRMLGRRGAASQPETAGGPLRKAIKQVNNYFAGKLDALDIPLELSGTEFQQNVWNAARTIPPGEVRSYAWLAQKIGNPRAVRAVANALGANPALCSYRATAW